MDLTFINSQPLEAHRLFSQTFNLSICAAVVTAAQIFQAITDPDGVQIKPNEGATSKNQSQLNPTESGSISTIFQALCTIYALCLAPLLFSRHLLEEGVMLSLQFFVPAFIILDICLG